MAHSLLMIPVSELDPVVRPRLERRSPEHLPVDPEETVAHISLLWPFADLTDITDGLRGELRTFFSDVTPFEFSLDGIHEFPEGAVYLSPSPVAPFRQLTHQLARRFPEYPPYGGAFDEVVPHLSIPMPEGEGVDQLAFELRPRFPITGHAREAALYWWEPGAGRTVDTFGFGTSAA